MKQDLIDPIQNDMVDVCIELPGKEMIAARKAIEIARQEKTGIGRAIPIRICEQPVFDGIMQRRVQQYRVEIHFIRNADMFEKTHNPAVIPGEFQHVVHAGAMQAPPLPATEGDQPARKRTIRHNSIEHTVQYPLRPTSEERVLHGNIKMPARISARTVRRPFFRREPVILKEGGAFILFQKRQ